MNRKEECRHAVLAHLAQRPRLAFAADSIKRAINRNGGDYTTDETAEACELLVGLEFASWQPDPLGSTRYYQVTGAGVLQYERGQ